MANILKSLPAIAFAFASMAAVPAMADDHEDKDRDAPSEYEAPDGTGGAGGYETQPGTDPYDPNDPAGTEGGYEPGGAGGDPYSPGGVQ